VQSNAGPPYSGAAGRTRTERVHLVAEGGGLRTIELYRVINTATHPELKALALAGQLHRLEDGRELAIPFVYHDPQNRKMALVVPGVLAHLEMKEWARLMAEIADDTDHAVPSYVRDCVTVVGLGALELFLETGVEPDDGELTEVPLVADDASSDRADRERALLERERMLLEREREIGEQEHSLIRLAGDLTSRESSILRREEQLATARVDLEVRESELGSGIPPALPRHDADVVPDGEWQDVSPVELAAPAVAKSLDALDPSGAMQQLGLRRRAPSAGFIPQQEEPTVVAALARVAASGVYAEPGLATLPGTHVTDPPPLPGGPRPGAPPPLRSGRPSRSTAPPPLHRESSSGRVASPPRDALTTVSESGLNPAPVRPASGPLGAAFATGGALGQPRASSQPLTPLLSHRAGMPESETRVAPAASAPIAPPISADPDLQVIALESLHAMLTEPARRVPALLEIARRRDPSSVPPVFALLDTLPVEHVIYASACLAVFGERAAEALIAGLGSPAPFVRQACAVVLGKLKLRRGLAPLLEQLESETSPAWQELARALGDFGLAALRALARGIHASSRRERLMVALAHLANHGCLQDLETMERDQDTVLALAARQALARRSRLHWEDEAVRRGGTLKDASPEARLSQALYATLEHLGLTA
jgi:hypothetical protein